MVIYPWYHWLYIYILGIGITNPLVWLVLPWAPEAKLAILRAHPAEVAGSSWGLVRCKEEVPDQRDKFEQFWKWCMCFWSFYTSWWFVAIDFDSCGLCRSKTGKVLSHRLHQAIVYLSTGVKAPMFQDAREPEKKKHYVPLGSPAHFRTQPLPVMCLIVLHMYVTFSNVLWLMPWQIPLTVVYWVCIKSRPPFENMCWVATNDQCLLSTYLWSISMLLRAPFLYTLAHTSIMVGELTLR